MNFTKCKVKEFKEIVISKFLRYLMCDSEVQRDEYKQHFSNSLGHGTLLVCRRYYEKDLKIMHSGC